LSIRAYRPADRAAVERICIENGLRGNLESYFKDPELFAKLWLSPFLDGEPESTWVLDLGGEVAGYLVSAIRPGFQMRALRTLAPHIGTLSARSLRGRYRDHEASRRFVRWFLTRSWREVPGHPEGLSNFHFNLTEAAQGQDRWGDRLMQAYFDRLREQGHRRFYAHVFASSAKRSLNFYRQIGFRVFDIRMSSLFEEPTVVACLERDIPNSLEFQKERARNLRQISLCFVGGSAEFVSARMGDVALSAMPAKEVLWESFDSARHAIRVEANAAVPLLPDALARVVARVDQGAEAGEVAGLRFSVRP